MDGMSGGAREPGPAPGRASTFDGAVLTSAFADALPELSVPWESARPEAPELVALNEGLARELGLDPAGLRSERGIRFLLGNALAAGSAPVAQAYAGHQFGGYSGRLGDGRALLLGEISARDGVPRDLHLKGSGRTPFARADGFAALGPMLREYVMGEAMHALGIPTTRALAVVATGRRLPRDGELKPGAVLARVAASHLRVGSFQYARSTGDIGLLRRLVDFALERHVPDAAPSRPDPASDPGTGRSEATGGRESALRLLDAVVAAQAELVAAWMLVGFVHGVMNTDNMTISGETIDYGPCAFIDAYDPAAVFSSIDHGGRYAYGNQPGIALWNLTRFAESLLPLLGQGGDAAGGSGDAAEAERLAIAALERFDPAYRAAWLTGMRGKLGLRRFADGGPEDATVSDLAAGLLDDLRAHRIDYTRAFRALAGAAESGDPRRGAVPVSDGADAATGLSRVFPDGVAPGDWFARWRDLGPSAELIRRSSPAVIPRNHLVDAALQAAEAGDLVPFVELLDAVSRPFEERPGFERYAQPPPPGAWPFVSYCGT